jgi:hypothetical protein
MRIVRLYHSVSFWIGVALAALIVLQLPPVPGIFFVMFGAPLITGLLMHGLLASLFLESVLNRIPKALALIPILAYGAYYADYFHEDRALQNEVSAVQNDQPAVALRFEPAEQSLVVKNARVFVSDYDVPVAYEANANVKPEGFEAYRRLSAAQCATARATYAMPGMTRLLPLGDGKPPRSHGNSEDDLDCVLATPERPPHAIVSISVRGVDETWRRTPGVFETAVNITLDGKPTATYVTGAYAWRLPPFPQLFIGCGLIDNPSEWKCTADFLRTIATVGRIDVARENTFVFARAAEMLGIDKVALVEGHIAQRPAADLDHLLAKLPRLAPIKPTENAPSDDRYLFSGFASFLASDNYTTTTSGAWTMLVVDGADHPSSELADAIMRDPARLGPLRDQMIAKLGAMRAHGISAVSPWVRLVARGLTLLPTPLFVTISDDSLESLLQYLRESEGWRYGGLYVRGADVGKRALPFYSADTVRYVHKWPQGENPALAICRIGEVDDAARQALRDAYLKFQSGNPKKMSFNVVQYGSALFLALLATGDEQFLRDHPINGADTKDGEWLALLLDGKGRVDGRPNNCVLLQRSPVSPEDRKAPGLIWSGQQWVETSAANGH